MTSNINEIKDLYTLFYQVNKKMKQLLLEDSKRHMMDAEPTWFISIIEDEIAPAIEHLLDQADADPCDEDGEPPMTADEMHTAAWQQHQLLHK